MMTSVLYVGQMWHGGTCRERARVLEANGWHVAPFDITPYQSSGGPILRRLEDRLLAGPNVLRFNRDLLRQVADLRNIDVVWIDKGRWLFASTLKELKQRTGAFLVHYTPDPAFVVHTSRHFQRCLPLYDLCVTTKRYELEAYRHAGAREVAFTWQGVDDRFSRIAECAAIDSPGRSGVVFIGHREPHYERILTSIAQAGLELSVYGQSWHRARWRNAELAPAIKGGPAWADAYARTLARAKVGLGLLSKLYPDQFTTRSFEIPAAGAMLLAERTAEHQELFDEGREAEFFADTAELIDKLRFYLAHDAARIAIAEKGRQRAITQHGWTRVMSPVLARIGSLTARGV